MKNNRVLAVFLVLCLFLCTFPVLAATEDKPQFAEFSQAFLDYASRQDKLPSDRAPFPIDMGERPEGMAGRANAVFPEIFDGRDQGYLPAVKNQMQTNTCWTFSATTALETRLKKKNGAAALFSARHMENATAQNPKDLKNPDAFSRHVESGGFQYIAAGYYMCGNGPVSDADMPFINDGTAEPTAARYQHPAAQVLDYQYLSWANSYPMDYNINEIAAQIKSKVINYGAVDIGIDMQNQWYSGITNSYYNPGASYSTTNHAVVVVGWDDNYPKESFLSPPSRDGAWIILNSWGDSWGDGGYFYVSYDEKSIYQLASCIRDAQESIDYDNRYYHDPLGWNQSLGYAENGNAAYGANIFQKPAGQELLTEVIFASRGYTDYEIYVNPTGGELTGGQIQLAGKGTVDYAGYKTIRLEQPVLLTGTEFAVILRYHTPNYELAVPVESNLSEDYHYPWASANARPGTSYLSKDGLNWEEISTQKYRYSNCSIKALTNDLSRKARVTFQKPSVNTVMSVYDEQGRELSPKADGSFSLPAGTYRYAASTYQKKDLTGSFTINDETETVVQVSGGLAPGDWGPAVEKPFLNYSQDREENGDLVFQVDFGSGSLAATSLTVYDTPVMPVEGKDYVLEGNRLIIKKDFILWTISQAGGAGWNLILIFDDPASTNITIQFDLAALPLNTASALVDAALHRFTSNDTLELVMNALSAQLGPQYELSFDRDFNILPPTAQGNGSITGSLLLLKTDTNEFSRLVYQDEPIYQAVLSLVQSGEIQVHANTDLSATFFFAQYRQSGQLLQLDSVPLKLSMGQDAAVSYHLAEDYRTAKAMLWDADSLLPLALPYP